MNDAAGVPRGYFRYFLFLSRPRGASINRQSMARLRFPTIPTSRRSIVPHVNYLQKINLKRVGADLLLTIYRSEKSFVTRRYNVMKNGHRCGSRDGSRVQHMQLLRKYNKLHAVIRPGARNYTSICKLADSRKEKRVPARGD